MSGNNDEILFFVKDEGSKIRILIISDTVEHFCNAEPTFCTHSVQWHTVDSFVFIETS